MSGATRALPQPAVHFEQGLGRKAVIVLRGLARHARAHRPWFVKGSLAALAVVAGRLSLPLPLKAVTDLWAGDGSAALWSIAPAVDPAVAMGVAFLALMLLLGGCDHLERFFFARFAALTANGLRASVVSATLREQASRPATGDLLSRLVGDAGRLKSGVESFLVQVATNGAVFVGMTVVLFIMEPSLGLIFVIAGLLIGAITLAAARRIFRVSLEHRANEAEFANRVRAAVDGAGRNAEPIGRSEGGHEGQQMRAQGAATWAAHAIFGLAVVAALWAGSAAVAGGRLGVGDMVLFMMYALTMRGPSVRLARQGAKTGRIFAAGYRLIQLTDPTERTPR